MTQRNAGRKTAGVDGEVALTSQDRADLAVRVQHHDATWQPPAVKRVYIPKSKPREATPTRNPRDRGPVPAGAGRNALEPEWEARFEPRSYGFRPGRGCHDAIGAIYTTCKGPQAKRLWVLDADLAAAFDRIDHAHLLGRIGRSRPGK